MFSPNSKLRKQVVPRQPVEREERQHPKAYGMSWAQRLKRVFAMDIEKCEKCGGAVRIIVDASNRSILDRPQQDVSLAGVH